METRETDMLPETIYESKLVHNEMRRERSMAIHDHLMHLPAGESVLQRLLCRLRGMNFRSVEATPSASRADTLNANHPPAFSK